MRFLSFHVNYFKSKVTKRGRSKIFEELEGMEKENSVENAIVLFISFDKTDENDTSILENGVGEIEKITNQLKISNVVLIPFAHLFGDLSSPEYALHSLKELEKLLQEKEYSTIRLPFGWFNELEMNAKGHPLSRISRIVK